MITLGDMITKVSELIKDPNNERYSKRLIRDRIASKLQLHVVGLGLLKKNSFIPFREGISIYPLAVDCFNLISLKLINYRGKVLLHSNNETENYLGNPNLGDAQRPMKGNPKVFFTDEVAEGFIMVAPVPTTPNETTNTAENAGNVPVYDSINGDPVTGSGAGVVGTIFQNQVVTPGIGAGMVGAIFEEGISYWYHRLVNVPEITNLTAPLDAELTKDIWLDDFEWWPAAEILNTSENPQDLNRAQRYFAMYNSYIKKKKRIRNSCKRSNCMRAI